MLCQQTILGIMFSRLWACHFPEKQWRTAYWYLEPDHLFAHDACEQYSEVDVAWQLLPARTYMTLWSLEEDQQA